MLLIFNIFIDLSLKRKVNL